ncbi:radical SAM protein [Candidatus Bathyarchaeota archaeon]|nr:MAG: radical SAM protein [Candidatus Bathyarchaeota archaeon ex4484_40]RLG93605.1 MAG: radical SAM protein [Candidatus Bathyarchaeota archaeon]
MPTSRIREKWRFLTVSSRWDRSTVPIYETSSPGGYVPLLKTLLEAPCRNDCAYCALRAGMRCPRESWGPEEIARITLRLWEDGKIRGLFLSSCVRKDPESTVEKQLEALRTLREMGYTGYIHLRLMPGISRHHVREAVELADRLGVNLEAPTGDIFSEMCPSKGDFREVVLKRLEWIVDEVRRAADLRVISTFGFGRAGVDTQMVVGAVHDNDEQYIRMVDRLYREIGLRRIYFSGFEPIDGTPLEDNPPCPPYREYRLYQVSFLIRDYGFKYEELKGILDDRGFLPNIDPKVALARLEADRFPINLNSADYYEILRVPGIGPVTARKIIDARKNLKIERLSDLEKILGPTLSRRVAPYIDLKDKRLTYFSKRFQRGST